MTDGVNSDDHRCALYRSIFNNVVLKLAFASNGLGRLRFCILNLGSAAAHVDEMAENFKDVELHIMCVCEKFQENQQISVLPNPPYFIFVPALNLAP
jgi:hypothetical protein